MCISYSTCHQISSYITLTLPLWRLHANHSPTSYLYGPYESPLPWPLPILTLSPAMTTHLPARLALQGEDLIIPTLSLTNNKTTPSPPSDPLFPPRPDATLEPEVQRGRKRRRVIQDLVLTTSQPSHTKQQQPPPPKPNPGSTESSTFRGRARHRSTSLLPTPNSRSCAPTPNGDTLAPLPQPLTQPSQAVLPPGTVRLLRVVQIEREQRTRRARSLSPSRSRSPATGGGGGGGGLVGFVRRRRRRTRSRGREHAVGVVETGGGGCC